MELLESKKPPIILILGMRQTGKSTLASSLIGLRKVVKFNFDLISDRKEFIDQNRHELSFFAKQHQGKIVVIDEVQKQPEATGIIKHLYDNFDMRFILTGSSELKIRKNMGDSLAGRVHEVRLYPLSLSEINIQSGLHFDKDLEFNNYDFNQELLLRNLIYGSLPNLQNIEVGRFEDFLRDFVSVIFSKDILELVEARKSTQIYSLARLLAFQIGQLVNFNELAIKTEVSRETVYRYIDLFEQMGLIVKAKPISTNEREAISKATKIYFTDLGVRNALVENFSALSRRDDVGGLLENAVFMGIKRERDYGGKSFSLGFFRSESGSEIDIVEKIGNAERLIEVKTTERKRRTKNVEIVTLETAQKYLY